MTIQSGNTTPKTSFPDMSGLTKQLKNVTTQFAVLNDRFTDIGSQLQLMADVLSSEIISINTTVNAVFSSIANDISENVYSATESIGNGIKETWSTFVNSFFESILPMFSSALTQFNAETSSIWSDVLSTTYAELNALIIKTWNQMLSDFFNHVNNAITATLGQLQAAIISVYQQTIETTYADIKTTALSTYQEVFEFITDAWSATLEPTVELMKNTISDIKDKIDDFYDNDMAPIADFIKKGFSENWKSIRVGIVSDFKGLINALIPSINDSVKTIIDWAVEVLNNLLKCVGKLLTNVTSSCFTLIQTLIVSIATLAGAAVGLMIGGPIGAAVGGSVGLIAGGIAAASIKKSEIKFAKIKTPSSYPAIKPFASGGVVTSPTYALIGEGKYPEAVMPLGNSPQMKDFINKVASAVGTNQTVQVFIGNEQLDEYIIKSQQRRMLKTNGVLA